MHQMLADATFRVECGQSAGSGFSFRHETIAVTNYHVVAPHFSAKSPIHVVTESGVRIGVNVLSHSPENLFDFAILQLQSTIPANRSVLEPRIAAPISRGTETIFAGFPHGIPDLLVHEAVVSGPSLPNGFYIDGSVNGGNSGGPIVEKATGKALGIVTQRRFFGAIQLNQLRQQVAQLGQYSQGLAGRGSVIVMGIDFGGFANMMSQGFLVIDQILQANANSGIGVGFDIDHVNQEYGRLGLP
jgi:hypothetical protein